MAILFSSVIVKSQSESVVFSVISVTPCLLGDNGFVGETQFAEKNQAVIIINSKSIEMIDKANDEVNIFSITERKYDAEEDVFLFTTSDIEYGYTVLVMVKNSDNVFTITFINTQTKESFIYKTHKKM